MKINSATGGVSNLDIGDEIWIQAKEETIVILERNGRFTIKSVDARPSEIDYMTAVSATLTWPNVVKNWEASEADKSER